MIEFKCLGCGHRLKLKDEMAGKRGKCPSCGDPLQIPTASVRYAEEPPPDPPPPPVPVMPPRVEHIPSYSPPHPPVASPGDWSVAGRGDAEGTRDRAPRRRGRSTPARWATRFALLGAIAGAVLVVILEPKDDSAVNALRDLLAKATASATATHVRGVLVGTACGLLLGGFMLAVTGRSGEGVVGTLVLLIGGGVYGWYRGGTYQEMAWILVLMGAVGGVLLGAVVGAMFGAILAAIRGN